MTAEAEAKPGGEGFVMLPNWVIRTGYLKPYELTVYLYLLSRANKRGLAWPSLKKIARETGISPSTVQRTIKELSVPGIIQVKKRKRPRGDYDYNEYRVATFNREEPENVVRWDQKDQGVRSERPHPRFRESNKEEPPEEEPLEEESNPEVDSLQNRRDSFFKMPIDDGQVTQSQLDYLHDLHIHTYDEVPTTQHYESWKVLTRGNASELIDAYNREVGRNGMYGGPDEGNPEYEALSERGKIWAYHGMMPDAAEHTEHLKEAS